ncbi:MAG TPA: UPF0158 family protein [Cyclobacteriaceae bacterium]|nr:UPF0158 family protein [Cyclobacteriaceae bacterium]
MKLTAKQINEIAQELEAGMKIFTDRENLEIRTILDWDDITDPGIWHKEQKKIEREWPDYITIEKLEPGESFRIMESFVDEINDIKLKQDLIKILSRKSPFANFKAEIESSAYRQKWFDFRTMKYEEYVKAQLEVENIEFEK